MALIRCPECGREVSDQAEACIHCGYPLQGTMQPPIWEKKKDASEVVIKMPEYKAYRYAEPTVNLKLDGRFIGNLKSCEEVTAPVERDCELLARCSNLKTTFPVQAGKKTVILVSFTAFGGLVLTESGKMGQGEVRKSGNPFMWVFLIILFLALVVTPIICLFFIK